MKPERCSKCNCSLKKVRFLTMNALAKQYYFCRSCAQGAFYTLSALPYRLTDEEDLLKQLRKFLSN